MNDTREDLGYVGTNRRAKKRVSIEDYGKEARKEKAKEGVIDKLIKELNITPNEG